MVFPNRKIKVNIQLVFQEFVFFFPLGQAVTRIFYGNAINICLLFGFGGGFVLALVGYPEMLGKRRKLDL